MNNAYDNLEKYVDEEERELFEEWKRYDQIALDNGLYDTVWGNYDVELDEVAVEGPVVLYNWWSGLSTPILDSPTWMDVWKAVDKVVEQTAPDDHCHLEGICFEKQYGDLQIYQMELGS